MYMNCYVHIYLYIYIYISTLCCQTTPTMLGTSEYLGDVVCSSVAKAPHGSQRPKRQAGKQASKGNTHNNPAHHPKETRRQGRRQAPQPAAARGTEATPTPPHHPKPRQKRFPCKLQKSCGEAAIATEANQLGRPPTIHLLV